MVSSAETESSTPAAEMRQFRTQLLCCDYQRSDADDGDGDDDDFLISQTNKCHEFSPPFKLGLLAGGLCPRGGCEKNLRGLQHCNKEACSFAARAGTRPGEPTRQQPAPVCSMMWASRGLEACTATGQPWSVLGRYVIVTMIWMHRGIFSSPGALAL